mmetsp:Transcript_10849/g.33271  ORF Transcript_10849/g.33271 Transcript_10849/m.33271 type:complete len:88 (-) Transcript_10849:11-274(-)
MTAKRSNRRSGGRSGERGKCLRVMLFGSHSVEEWKRLLEERSVNDGQKEQQKVRREEWRTRKVFAGYAVWIALGGGMEEASGGAERE